MQWTVHQNDGADASTEVTVKSPKKVKKDDKVYSMVTLTTEAVGEYTLKAKLGKSTKTGPDLIKFIDPPEFKSITANPDKLAVNAEAEVAVKVANVDPAAVQWEVAAPADVGKPMIDKDNSLNKVKVKATEKGDHAVTAILTDAIKSTTTTKVTVTRSQ